MTISSCSCVICCTRRQNGWDTKSMEDRAKEFEQMVHHTSRDLGGTDCTGLIWMMFIASSLLREVITRIPEGDGK